MSWWPFCKTHRLGNPKKIRQRVEEHFSIATFTQSYLELYQRIIAGEALNPTLPRWKYSQRAEELLPF